MPANTYTRNRWWIAGLGLVVIALGLTSRKIPELFPVALGTYPGDALWALTAYLAIGLVVPNLPVWKLAVFALVACYAVEFSQLFQSPWVNAVRNTRIGHLLLGQGFDWMDLVAQTVGIGLGATVDAMLSWSAQRTTGI